MVETKDRPTVILSKRLKVMFGAAGEGQNITHSQKMGEEDRELELFWITYIG